MNNMFYGSMLLALTLSLLAGHCSGGCPSNYTSIYGGCFAFMNDLRVGGWDEARDACRETGGDLAIIQDCYLFSKIVRHIHASALEVPDQNGYWIGGSDRGDEGSWFWIDGSPVALGIPFWGSNNNATEPSGGTEQNCMLMYHDDRYYFHDGECYLAGYPLCQARSVADEQCEEMLRLSNKLCEENNV